MESKWIVVYFEKDNTYSIIHDEKNLLKNSNKANIKSDNGKWLKGDIK